MAAVTSLIWTCTSASWLHAWWVLLAWPRRCRSRSTSWSALTLARCCAAVLLPLPARSRASCVTVSAMVRVVLALPVALVLVAGVLPGGPLLRLRFLARLLLPAELDCLPRPLLGERPVLS